MRKNLFSIALGGLLAIAGAAEAQDYPTRPITLVVPFAAGGPTDTVARLIGQSMSKTLGQQVIVDNVAGAGGTLGPARVAKAAADGYTILLHHIGMATTAILYRKLPYNALTDFEYIGLVGDAPMTIVARKTLAANKLSELVDYVKQNKDKVTLANAGVGAASHLCGMLFQSAVGVPLTTVPYKGTGPAMNDLVGGQVDIMCDQTTGTTEQIKGGTIKAYAATTKKRVSSLPDLVTTAEAGMPQVQVAIWHGVYAPKGTPKPVLDKLINALQVAIKDDIVRQRFADLGIEIESSDRVNPQALQAQLKAEIDRWAPVIKAAGVYAD
ncbi:MAG: tripartite tricarboxylate transporter substrate binding protein BugD [Alphaproteobacteria bacterium]|nr:tripartite tricarboxylate transporter substrate binding protein BugD [Alphaproteobacteria bacterium]